MCVYDETCILSLSLFLFLSLLFLSFARAFAIPHFALPLSACADQRKYPRVMTSAPGKALCTARLAAAKTFSKNNIREDMSRIDRKSRVATGDERRIIASQVHLVMRVPLSVLVAGVRSLFSRSPSPHPPPPSAVRAALFPPSFFLL